MRQDLSNGLCAVAAVSLVLATASTAIADTRQGSGKVCWTGTADVIATTKADVAYTWKLDFVYTSDDDDPKKSLTGKCISIRGIVAGKKERAPHFCINYAADGSTYMSRAITLSDETTKAAVFGGTGALEGVTGGHIGAKPEEMKAPKGMFAGCRKLKGELTLPG